MIPTWMMTRAAVFESHFIVLQVRLLIEKLCSTNVFLVFFMNLFDTFDGLFYGVVL